MGIASMVKSDRLQMALIAREIEHKLQIAVQVGGAEAEAAILGALTTPGTTRPLAILDLGAGSTDASIINAQGRDQRHSPGRRRRYGHDDHRPRAGA